MDSSTPKHSSPATGSRRHGSPEGKIIGAFEPSELDALIPALIAEGFPRDQIDVVTADDIPQLEAPFDRQGFAGAISRFVFSIGDELDGIEEMRDELRSGHVLVGVPARGHEIQRVHTIMREHGGHGVVSVGRWTVTHYEEN